MVTARRRKFPKTSHFMTSHPKGKSRRGAAAQPYLFPSKIKIQHSSIDNSSSVTPLATSRPGAAAQPYLPFASFGVIRGSTFFPCR
jgi:hypothetical protein